MPNTTIQLNRFPDTSPYLESIEDDIPFDPAIHLALEQPEQIFTLSDFGSRVFK